MLNLRFGTDARFLILLPTSEMCPSAEPFESSRSLHGKLAVFMSLSAHASAFGAPSTHELVRKDQLKELARVADSDDEKLDEYASFVMIPLLLLFGTIVLVRRSMLP
jgi:hypothetical protein